MEYLLIIVVALGFFKGLLKGFRKSLKSLLQTVIAFLIFGIVFAPLVDVVAQTGIFKEDVESVVNRFVNSLPMGSVKFDTKEEMLIAIKNSELSSLLKNILICGVDFGEFNSSLGIMLSSYIYRLIISAIIGIVLFIILSNVVRLIFSIGFFKVNVLEGLNITKRVLAGLIGVLKSALVIFAAASVFTFFTEALALGDLINGSGSVAYNFVASFLKQPMRAYLTRIL